MQSPRADSEPPISLPPLKEHELLSASASRPHRTPKPTEKGLAYQQELKRENLAKTTRELLFFCSQLESQLNSPCFPVEHAPAYLEELHNRSAETTSLFDEAQALKIELTEFELQKYRETLQRANSITARLNAIPLIPESATLSIAASYRNPSNVSHSCRVSQKSARSSRRSSRASHRSVLSMKKTEAALELEREIIQKEAEITKRQLRDQLDDIERDARIRLAKKKT